MNQTFEQARVHAVVVLKMPGETLDSKEICKTKCGKTLSFANLVKNDATLSFASMCKICLKASKNQIKLPEGWRIVYLSESE